MSFQTKAVASAIREQGITKNQALAIIAEMFDKPKRLRYATSYAANPSAVAQVLAEPVGIDGRSEFRWFDLADGAVILAVIPLGTGYERTEGERARDYTLANSFDPSEYRVTHHTLSETDIQDHLV